MGTRLLQNAFLVISIILSFFEETHRTSAAAPFSQADGSLFCMINHRDRARPELNKYLASVNSNEIELNRPFLNELYFGYCLC